MHGHVSNINDWDGHVSNINYWDLSPALFKLIYAAIQRITKIVLKFSGPSSPRPKVNVAHETGHILLWCYQTWEVEWRCQKVASKKCHLQRIFAIWKKLQRYFIVQYNFTNKMEAWPTFEGFWVLWPPLTKQDNVFSRNKNLDFWDRKKETAELVWNLSLKSLLETTGKILW